MEVLNAADPSRAGVAAQRLSALASSNGPAGDFAADLARVASAPAASALPAGGLANARAQFASLSGGPDKTAKAKIEFETLMLNSFVGEMLPKDASDVFGQGYAGEMWRSMLSEQISRQIAKSGALGLSKRLFATHELAPSDRPSHPGETAQAATDAAQMSANILSAPAGAADVANGAVLFAGRKRS